MTQHATGIKKWPERFEDLLDRVRELPERWNNRLTLHNLALAERYLKGELHVAVTLEVVARDAEHLHAVFEVYRPAPILDVASRPNNVVYGLLKRDHGRTYHDEQAVLVGDAESVELPERVVPSRVWVGRSDELNRSLTRSLYLSFRHGFKSVGTRGDRESRFRRRYFGVDYDELIDQEVECRSKVVDGIADHGRPTRGQGVATGDTHDDITGLSLHVAMKRITVTLEEEARSRFKVVDVLVGPFDFRPWPIERVV